MVGWKLEAAEDTTAFQSMPHNANVGKVFWLCNMYMNKQLKTPPPPVYLP